MTDGGSDFGRVRGVNEGTSSRAGKRSGGGDEFARAIAQIAVAQISESAGFQASRQSALEVLADIAMRYIRDLATSAHFHTNSSGRTESNVFDVILALEELNSPIGFLGASDIDHSLSESGTIRDIMQYTSLSDEIPFARPLHKFPITRKQIHPTTFLKTGEEPPLAHIPSWLPVFPDPHTYKDTPVWNEREADPKAEKVEQARQRRKAERSLLKLQQRLMCNGAVPMITLSEADAADSSGLKDTRQTGNSFLAAPFHFGEKEVSQVPLPSGLTKNLEGKKDSNVPSVVETFRPVIEAAKNGSEMSSNGDKQPQGQGLPRDRPSVHFKFGVLKNVVGSTFDLGVRNSRSDIARRSAAWFSRDEEKDDKKRRAEQILKESIDNPQELAQF